MRVPAVQNRAEDPGGQRECGRPRSSEGIICQDENPELSSFKGLFVT
jgi:hypothetical protein